MSPAPQGAAAQPSTWGWARGCLPEAVPLQLGAVGCPFWGNWAKISRSHRHSLEERQEP